MSNLLHVVNISFVIPYFLGKQLNYFTEKGIRNMLYVVRQMNWMNWQLNIVLSTKR